MRIKRKVKHIYSTGSSAHEELWDALNKSVVSSTRSGFVLESRILFMVLLTMAMSRPATIFVDGLQKLPRELDRIYSLAFSNSVPVALQQFARPAACCKHRAAQTVRFVCMFVAVNTHPLHS